MTKEQVHYMKEHDGIESKEQWEDIVQYWWENLEFREIYEKTIPQAIIGATRKPREISMFEGRD